MAPESSVPPEPEILRPRTSTSFRGRKPARMPRLSEPPGRGLAHQPVEVFQPAGDPGIVPREKELPAELCRAPVEGAPAGDPTVDLDPPGPAVVEPDLLLHVLWWPTRTVGRRNWRKRSVERALSLGPHLEQDFVKGHVFRRGQRPGIQETPRFHHFKSIPYFPGPSTNPRGEGNPGGPKQGRGEEVMSRFDFPPGLRNNEI